MKFFLCCCFVCFFTITCLEAQYEWEQDFLSIDSVVYENNPALYERVNWLTYQTKKSPLGWQIDYFVKKDSTLLEDIYIRISKGNFENVHKGSQLLTYRSYFIPIYQTETTDKILLKHGCSTYCSAITMLSKLHPDSSQTYNHVVNYNSPQQVLIHVTDSSYQHQNQFFQLEIVNLKNNKVQQLKIPGNCGSVHLPSCVERVTYHQEYLEIVTSRRNSTTEELEQVTSFVSW